MNIRRFLICLTGLIVVLSLMQSCSPKEITQNTEVTFSPVEKTEETKAKPQAETPEVTAFTKSEDELPSREESEVLPEMQENDMTCTLLVRCDDVFNHPDRLKETKRAILPEDGIIYPETEVNFSDGESVFDVLYREMKKEGIHLEFVNTPMYNCVYIEGINNLYEFDCGSTSGWIYEVNGESPMHGCSRHKVKKDDKIEFINKCSLY